MEYSKKTQALIDRMCAYVERKEFVLNKPEAEKLILKTYDLFNLDRPKNIVWCIDILEKDFDNAASSALSASLASLASSALSAWSASSASLALSDWSASSASLALSDWSASSASSASSARSVWLASSDSLASSASLALDNDFDWFIFAYEYEQNPDKNFLPNNNDTIYLKYCELLISALEAGLGYRVEYNDTLYLVPTPIVRLNKDTPPQYHSDQLPAIEWIGGSKIYFLDGVKFEKTLWEKVVSKEMSLSEIMKIEISDQRTIALKYNPQAILAEKAKLLHKDNRSNELYLVENSEINKITNSPKMYFLKMTCPTGRVFIEGVDPKEAEKNPNATDMQALLCGLTPSEYAMMTLES